MSASGRSSTRFAAADLRNYREGERYRDDEDFEAIADNWADAHEADGLEHAETQYEDHLDRLGEGS